MPPISPDRWRALSPYLDQALDISADQRGAWLAALAARDAALARDLEAMLAERDTADDAGFLDGAILDQQGATPSLAGQVLGAYRLQSLIGQGGSGSVWLAERADGRFEGKAAVKLLNLALINRAGEERFRREGTFLARLRHPRIAHLIDAGVARSGQPYLVLEHVDGVCIDRFCDEKRLSVDSRVRLFLDVLDAVAHAHANLIVHRDIKPANVLVGVADGQVKLLDFGIARLAEPADGDGGAARQAGAVTRDVGKAMTPEFAAPEQLSGGPVTTATDVYALGVLLYLLLTGQHPAGRAVRSPATLIRAIVDTEAPRVSDAVVTGAEGDDLSRHAAHCGTTLPRLRRALRGDLDTIVAKALKKNAAERYPSVTALAEDLARYLRHEPIGARPDSIRYRAARFVQRHAIGVATAAAVGSLVVGLTIFHTARLSAERDRAQRETAKAVKVSDMLMQVLTSADPYTIRDSSGQPSLRALLDAGTTQVKTQFASEPDVQADMLTTLGRSYRRMGEYDKAQGLLEQALTAGQRAFGSEHIRIAQTLDYLGTVLADKGDYGAAGRSLERALAMRRKLLGPAHPDVAVTLVELGRIYQDNGLNARAEPLHRESLQIRRATLGPEHREVAVSLSDLASVLRLNGDLAGAESLLRECLQINRKTRGEEHPNTATTLHDLALIAAAGGDYRSAEAQLRVVLDMQRRTLGDSHPLLATTLNSLAHVLVRTGRYAEARQQLERALAIVRPVFNRDHQAIAIDSLNLAAVDMALNAPAAAEPLLREGIRIRALAPGLVPMRRRTLLEDDWSVGAAKSLLGAALVALKRYDEAEATLLDARRELEAATQPQPREIATALTRLIDLYAAWGKPDRAAAFRARLAS